MTYKLNPALKKILSPIVIISPDGMKKEYRNGNELIDAVFDKCYTVKSIEAQESVIQIILEERIIPEMNWYGEEAVSFF